MNLADYDSSSDEEIKGARPAPYSKAPPPPPKDFLNLFTAPPKLSAHAAQHQGRTRVVPHTQGSWPSHIYIEWLPSGAQAKVLSRIVDAVDKSVHSQVHSLVRSELGAPQSLHISLSATLMVPTSELGEFKNSVNEALQSFFEDQGDRPLECTFDGWKMLQNDNGTRSFVVLPLKDPSKTTITGLVETLNLALAPLRLPAHPTDTPHVSIGWIPGVEKEALSNHESDNSEKAETLCWRAEWHGLGVSLKIGRDIEVVYPNRK